MQRKALNKIGVNYPDSKAMDDYPDFLIIKCMKGEY